MAAHGVGAEGPDHRSPEPDHQGGLGNVAGVDVLVGLGAPADVGGQVRRRDLSAGRLAIDLASLAGHDCIRGGRHVGDARREGEPVVDELVGEHGPS